MRMVLLMLVLGAIVAPARAGDLVTFQALNSDGTTPYDVNNEGQIVGATNITDVMSGASGFLRQSSGNIASLGVDQYAYSINNHGDILTQDPFTNTSFINGQAIPGLDLLKLNDHVDAVGFVPSKDATGAGVYRHADGQVDSIPNINGHTAYAWGLNNRGDIVGQFVANGNPTNPTYGGFLIQHQDYAHPLLLSYPGATNFFPMAVNNQDEIVGWLTNSVGYHGFLREPDGQITLIDVPNITGRAGLTWATGINDLGQITGTYGPAFNVGGKALGTEGFLYTPLSVPEPTSLALGGMAIALLLLIKVRYSS